MAPTPANVGEALWIGDQPGQNHFKIDIGLGNSGGSDDLTLTQAQIASGIDEPGKFFLTTNVNEGPVVEYRINAGASKTSENTKFPRSEKREMQRNGTSNAAWGGNGDTHYMEWRGAITAVGLSRAWVCMGQIHDGDGDRLRLQTQGNGLTGLDFVARYNKTGQDEETVVLINGAYNVGDFINVRIEVVGDDLYVFVNGVQVLFVPSLGLSLNAYFKLGDYMQSNVDDYGEDPDTESAVQVVAGSLVVWHTGYALPTTPVWTGPDDPDPTDTLPPTVPQNVIALRDDGQITLTWDESTDNVGVDHYNIYRQSSSGTVSSFGKDTDAANSTASSADKMAVSLATATADGTLTNGHSRMWLSAGGATNTKLVVYANVAGSPGALLAESDEQAIVSTVEEIIDYTFSGINQIAVVSGTSYFIGVAWGDPGAISVTYSRDNIDNGRLEQNISYPTMPDPFGTPSGSFDGPIDVWMETGGGAGYVLHDETDSTTYVDTGLTNGTNYSYRISAEDVAGNESGLSDEVSQTPGPPDTTPPTVPTVLVAIPDDGRVSLSWDASTDDDSGLSHYVIYRDGVAINTVTSTFFADTSVTNGVEYSYTVSAVDNAGNESAQTAPELATPAAAPVAGRPFLVNDLGPNAAIALEIAFGADLLADEDTWEWTDVTQHVRFDPTVNTFLGRNDESETSNPANMSLVLDNDTGNYSLGGHSIHWPFVRRNTPVRFRVDPDDGGGGRVIYFGFADGFTPGYDSLRGNIPIVTCSVSGTMRRLEQGNAPIMSAFRRAMSTSESVVAYWPMEEGKNATYAPALRGGSRLTFTGDMNWGEDTTFNCSDALPTLGNAVINAEIFPYSDTGETQMRWLMAIPENGMADGTVIAHIFTTGSLARWDLTYEIVGGSPSLGIFRRFANGELEGSDLIGFGINGIPGRMSLELRQVGDDIHWLLGHKDARLGTGGAGVFDGVVEGETAGIFRHIIINPAGAADDLVIGHLTVENEINSLFTATDALIAHFGELPTTPDGRLRRLQAENNIGIFIYGGAGTVGEKSRMGPQLVAPLLDLLREVETSDQGQLWDGRHAGLSYTTRRHREDGQVRLTIDAGNGELAGPFQPTDDDQRDVNRMQVSRLQGVTFTYEDVNGPRGTANIGFYDSSLTVNNANDDMMEQYAQWFVHLGTAEGYRYPSVTVDIRASPHLVGDVLNVVPGERINVTNLDDALYQFPGGIVSLIVEGIKHEISPEIWRVTFMCSPFSPWGLGIVAAETGDTSDLVMRLDTDGSELNASAGAGATNISVATPNAALWTTNPDDFPFWIRVGGIPVRVTACVGDFSPQTFTCDPLTHDRSSGVSVELYDPRPIGMDS